MSKHQPSSNTLKEAQTAYMGNKSEQFEWNVGDWASDSETQADTFPSNPFVFDGARPVISTRRKNVILFGETGVGKSSVINLMAGADVALTSSKLEGCTLEATDYAFTLPGETSFCIYDTVGLNEPHIAANSFFGAIEKAHQLVASLHHAGGVDLLVFCIRGGRITTTMQRNYRLFFEFLCDKKVPLALIVTNLEHEDDMERWWRENEQTFGKYGIQSVAHACVTAAPARVSALAAKRAESQRALQKMLLDSFKSPSSPYVKDVWSWFSRVVEMLRSFFVNSILPMSLRRKDLSRRLRDRCGLSQDEAQQLADMLMRGT